VALRHDVDSNRGQMNSTIAATSLSTGCVKRKLAKSSASGSHRPVKEKKKPPVVTLCKGEKNTLSTKNGRAKNC